MVATAIDNTNDDVVVNVPSVREATVVGNGHAVVTMYIPAE